MVTSSQSTIASGAAMPSTIDELISLCPVRSAASGSGRPSEALNPSISSIR
jgi:hypothetical protein